MPSLSRDPAAFLRDIEIGCAKIGRYTASLSRDEVFADEMRFDGILFNLQVIGEAVKNLPEEFRERHTDVPWREIAGMRDIVVHAYFALDLDILWNAVSEAVPSLLQRIRSFPEAAGYNQAGGSVVAKEAIE